MVGIFYWCAQRLKWDTIGLWCGFSRKQVWKLTKACRLVAANFMLENPDANKIGGVNRAGQPITCQVDETFCGKRKNHKGQGKIQTWVLGGIEMPDATEPQRIPRCFALTVPNRKKITLIPTLKAKIKKESRVWTDGFRSYYTLRSHFGDWDMVNHTLYFTDPATGVNTNRCEGMWKHLKSCILQGTSRAKIEEYVQLFNFREWVKCEPRLARLGLFGALARANNCVSEGDAIPNMVIAEAIVAANPLPEPAPAVSIPTASRGRGRPKKRSRRGKGVSAEV